MQRFVTRVSLGLAVLLASGARAEEPKLSPEQARSLNQRVKAFTEAFNKGDADALGKFWTEDADHIDTVGRTRKGRKAIVDAYRKLFAAQKGAKLTIIPLSRRVLTPDCIIGDGLSEVTPAGGGAPSTARYTSVSVKKDGRWYLASVRETIATPPSNFEHLEDLEFLVGSWTDENGKGEKAHVSYSWEFNQNFLVAHFAATLKDVQVAGGVQWIGWDPTARRIRAWTFDNNGGFSEGVWSKNGKTFTVEIHSVLRDGGKVSSTNVITRVDADHFTWQSTKRKVDGKDTPDSPVVKFKRVK